MESQLHIKSFKKGKIVDFLSSSVDRRRNYYLYICTCYFSPYYSAKQLIYDIRDKGISISEVFIYIDRKSAVELGGNFLSSFCNSFKNTSVNIFAVEHEYLFHSKCYGLISFDEHDEIHSGSLVIGSANLTGAGMTARSGNIECMINLQDIDVLQELIDQTKNLNTVDIQNIVNFSRADEYNFKFALIQEGLFLHKWTDNVEQYLSVRYRLSDKGKQMIGDETLEQAGFNIETATINKRYFKFNYEPSFLEDKDNITAKYGIETHLGYWVPSAIFESTYDKKDFEEFKSLLFEKLNNEIDDIKYRVNNDLYFLLNEELIESENYNPLESFDKKIENLKENEVKLKRMYSKYGIFYLPYDMGDKDDIEDLFNEILMLSESRSRKNITMRALLKSYSSYSIHTFRDEINKFINISN